MILREAVFDDGALSPVEPNVNSPPVPAAKLKLGVALKFMPVEGPVDEELAPKGALLVLGV